MQHGNFDLYVLLEEGREKLIAQAQKTAEEVEAQRVARQLQIDSKWTDEYKKAIKVVPHEFRNLITWDKTKNPNDEGVYLGIKVPGVQHLQIEIQRLWSNTPDFVVYMPVRTLFTEGFNDVADYYRVIYEPTRYNDPTMALAAAVDGITKDVEMLDRAAEQTKAHASKPATPPAPKALSYFELARKYQRDGDPFNAIAMALIDIADTLAGADFTNG